MANLRWLRLLLFVSMAQVSMAQFAATARAAPQERAELVKEDLANFERDEYWIYNNLERGIATARETQRPLLIVFR